MLFSHYNARQKKPYDEEQCVWFCQGQRVLCPVSGDHTKGRVAVDPSFFLSRWQHQLTADTRSLVQTCLSLKLLWGCLVAEVCVGGWVVRGLVCARVSVHVCLCNIFIWLCIYRVWKQISFNKFYSFSASGHLTKKLIHFAFYTFVFKYTPTQPTQSRFLC